MHIHAPCRHVNIERSEDKRLPEIKNSSNCPAFDWDIGLLSNFE